MEAPQPLSSPVSTHKQVWGILAALAMLVAMTVLTLGSLGVFNFRFLRDQNITAREAARQLEKSAGDERVRMAQSIRNGEIQGGDAAMARIQGQLEETAAKLNTADAAAARAMANFMGRMRGEVRDYQVAAAHFTQAQLFRPSFTDKGAIDENRKIVREFLAQNARLSETLNNGESMLRGEMDGLKIPAQTRDNTLAGFSRSQAAIRPVQMRIRACDQTLGDAALVALDLFERHWGRWRRETSTGDIFFADQAARISYGALIQQVQTAADQQAQAQEELAVLMSAGKKR